MLLQCGASLTIKNKVRTLSSYVGSLLLRISIHMHIRMHYTRKILMRKNFDEYIKHLQNFDEQNFDKLIVGFIGKALTGKGWKGKL